MFNKKRRMNFSIFLFLLLILAGCDTQNINDQEEVIKASSAFKSFDAQYKKSGLFLVSQLSQHYGSTEGSREIEVAVDNKKVDVDIIGNFFKVFVDVANGVGVYVNVFGLGVGVDVFTDEVNVDVDLGENNGVDVNVDDEVSVDVNGGEHGGVQVKVTNEGIIVGPIDIELGDFKWHFSLNLLHFFSGKDWSFEIAHSFREGAGYTGEFKTIVTGSYGTAERVTVQGSYTTNGSDDIYNVDITYDIRECITNLDKAKIDGLINNIPLSELNL